MAELDELVDARGFFGEASHEAGGGASQAGLLVALMSLFDTDGSRTLTREEWMGGNEALELETSEEEWQALLKRFGGTKEGVVAFSEAVEMFGLGDSTSSPVPLDSDNGGKSLDRCRM